MRTKVKFMRESDPQNLAHAIDKFFENEEHEYSDFIPLGPGSGLLVFRSRGKVGGSTEVRDPDAGV